MSFCIQTGKPSFSVAADVVAEDLSEGIEQMFPMLTDDASIVWNGVNIPISYKYDLSVFIDDLLLMILSIVSSERGKYQIRFGSDTFDADWKINWENESLFISAMWYEVSGYLETVSNECSTLEISRKSFLEEWNGILKYLKKAIYSSKIKIVNTSELNLLTELVDIIDNKHW